MITEPRFEEGHSNNCRKLIMHGFMLIEDCLILHILDTHILQSELHKLLLLLVKKEQKNTKTELPLLYLTL